MAASSSFTSASSTGPTRVSSTWPLVAGGRAFGRSAASWASIQGVKKNWMKVKGRRISRKIVPERSTTIVNSRPASEWKVMSPKPRVDIVTNVQ